MSGFALGKFTFPQIFIGASVLRVGISILIQIVLTLRSVSVICKCSLLTIELRARKYLDIPETNFFFNLLSSFVFFNELKKKKSLV